MFHVHIDGLRGEIWKLWTIKLQALKNPTFFPNGEKALIQHKNNLILNLIYIHGSETLQITYINALNLRGSGNFYAWYRRSPANKWFGFEESSWNKVQRNLRQIQEAKKLYSVLCPTGKPWIMVRHSTEHSKNSCGGNGNTAADCFDAILREITIHYPL